MIALQISPKTEILDWADRPQNFKPVWNFATFAGLPF